MTLYLTEAEVNQVLSMELALETVEQAFRLMSEGGATNPPRSRIRLPDGGLFNFMCAAAPGAGVMGLKAYGVVPGNPVKFYVQLFSTETGELLALLEAGDLGQVRTGRGERRRHQVHGARGRIHRRRHRFRLSGAHPAGSGLQSPPHHQRARVQSQS